MTPQENEAMQEMEQEDKEFSDAQKIVAKGVSFLTEHTPGWRKFVKEPVKIESFRYCILGQMFWSYEIGVSMLFLDTNKDLIEKLGFSGENCQPLNKAWNEELGLKVSNEDFDPFLDGDDLP